MIRHARPARGLAIALSSLAGFIDALGFLKLGGFFVSFMSGNSTRIGVGFATLSGSAAIGGGLVASFVLGVVLASLVGHVGHRHRPAIVLGLVTTLLFAAALANDLGAGAIAITLMAGAMGAENAVFQQRGEVSIGVHI